MRARMLVDARVLAEGAPDRAFSVGQELEGADAEFQVALGHAEVLAEAAPESAEVEKPKRRGSASE